MNVRSRALLASLLFLLALVVAFAVVDFHAMESQTAADSSVGTARANNASAPVGGPIQLVVLGEGPVAEGLEPALAAKLESRWGPVDRAAEPSPDFDGPVLVVAVTESELRYNPITPSARVAVDFAFVGSGNGTLAERLVTTDSGVVLTNRDAYVAQGGVTIRDESRGIASRPGYRSHVTERLADRFVNALTSAPGM